MNDEHKFTPNGDVLVQGSFVRIKKKFLGIEYTTTGFRLDCDHTYDGPTYHVFAPRDYVFDGATVPRFLWSFFERFGLWTRAAMYHDILYDRRIGTKAAADALFLEIMERDKVPWYVRYPMFIAVLLWPMNIYYWRRKNTTRAGGYCKRKASQ